MISSEKQAANRRNASRSTGPRTARGKARSKRNALKHGLAVSALDAFAAREVRDLAARFTAEGFVSEALPLAEASYDLRRDPRCTCLGRHDAVLPRRPAHVHHQPWAP